MAEAVVNPISADMFENHDPIVPEHEDSADHHSNADLQLEDLKLSESQETSSSLSSSVQVPSKATIAPLAKKSATMSVDPSKKSNGGPPTPTVKKVISSGTFGVGSVKPAGAKAATPAAPKATAPALKKPTTSAPGTTSKPTLASSASSKPSVTSAAIRRASAVPTKTTLPSSLRPSLSTSANAKPPSESGTVRSSVASPTGSVGSAKAGTTVPSTRPRASVSEAVKKPPLSSRPSLSSSVKTAAPGKTTSFSRSVAPPARSTKVGGSISSIKEIREDGKVLEELQGQLAEAAASLEAKSITVSDLEKRIAELQESLTTRSQELEGKIGAQAELQEAREVAESKLLETQNSLHASQEELQQVTATLQSVRDEQLETSKSSAIAQSKIVQELENRISDLEAALVASKKQIEHLESNSAVAQSSAAEAASVEHDALLKVQADFKTISDESEALKVTHTKALQDAENTIADLRSEVESVKEWEAQVTSLKAEKEENANKLSELEVEILELKETQEGLEDTRDQLQRQIAAQEDQLAKSAVAAGSAAEAASQKESAHAQQLETLVQECKKDLEAAAVRHSEVVASLEALKTELAEAVAAKEGSEQEISEREKRHSSALAEVEQQHASQLTDLESRLEKTLQELRDQESIYDAKVEAVKMQHDRLLKEAFERAKSEAAQAHSQELQILRSNSNATIEQIQTANQVTVDSLKDEHQSALETEVNALQKHINQLNIELKATQDDLVKAKTSLDASQTEIETLTQQLQAARTQAEASQALSPEHADEIARLTQELSNSKDDLAAMTDMLSLTKSSMTELSDKHAKEMEEVAKARADEILNLRSTHDSEVNALATQKSDLVVKLSDLEGELATVRAALEAQQAASPRRNGLGHSRAPSTVTKEELTKMHEAHNLKVYDLQAGHDKAIKAAKEDLDAAFIKISELQQDLARKAMEIQYLEQDQEESQEQITRLKEDLDRLSGQEQ
ncbi:hypothetical protein CPB84DRAFT_499192 [Gymnopilus junonius]|uniref:Uncharacterized protein n=1 Tax=Gymnopilus junonius TaxID=109634 RepID=A0A9P5P0P9_GYMJU|nr:hypothetical protein CPB84DRAFT_499192 [Gymnopilus junonius]